MSLRYDCTKVEMEHWEMAKRMSSTETFLKSTIEDVMPLVQRTLRPAGGRQSSTSQHLPSGKFDRFGPSSLIPTNFTDRHRQVQRAMLSFTTGSHESSANGINGDLNEIIWFIHYGSFIRVIHNVVQG
ncbi:hypothetical protein PAMP_007537 [Pampus punctatissimus]